jgi:hypothetical protein
MLSACITARLRYFVVSLDMYCDMYDVYCDLYDMYDVYCDMYDVYCDMYDVYYEMHYDKDYELSCGAEWSYRWKMC